MLSIQYVDHHLDLHNCFHFEGMEILQENGLRLNFKKSSGDWVQDEELLGFSLQFYRTTKVYTKDHDEDYPREHLENDAACPDLLGFSYSGDAIMTGPTDYHKSSDDLPAFLFTLVTGKAIKIMAESVELFVSKH